MHPSVSLLHLLAHPARNQGRERDCGRKPNGRRRLVHRIRQRKDSNLLAGGAHGDAHLTHTRESARRQCKSAHAPRALSSSDATSTPAEMSTYDSEKETMEREIEVMRYALP